MTHSSLNSSTIKFNAGFCAEVHDFDSDQTFSRELICISCKVPAPCPPISGFGQMKEFIIELSTNLREVSQCSEKAPTMAFSLLKTPTSVLTIKNKNLLHYAKLEFKHDNYG